MPSFSAEEIVKQLADAGEDFSLSLRDVLNGAMDELGGAKQFGELLGRLMKDEEVPINSRVSLINNYLKLMGQFSEKKNDDDFTPEQIAAQIKECNES